MPVNVNLRHFEEGNITLEGQIDPVELDLAENPDDLARLREPIHFRLEIEKNDNNLHAFGRLGTKLDLTCRRCLKEFKQQLEMNPYHLYVPLEGEDAAPVQNDLVDLSPFFREDTLLAFPQHPLCSENCAGLANASGPKIAGTDKTPPGNDNRAAWSALDKLKL